MNRRVLLICYYFPPLGLGGVGRPLNLFKQLPQHGYDCDILTVKPVLYRAYEPELLNGLDASRIHRAGSRDPQRIMYLLGFRKVKAETISKGRAVSEKFFPDSKIGWVKPAIKLGRKLCARNDYDVIISTSPPMSSHLVGLELSKQFGIPLVADFRDFWTIYKVEDVFIDPAKRARGLALLERIKTEAAAITTVNSSIAAYLNTGETITNGYDVSFAEHWKTPPGGECFTVGLLGHQHDTKELQPLVDLYKQVEALREKKAEIRLLQVGQVDPEWLAAFFREQGCDWEFDIRGHLPREATIQTLSQAHLFYIGISEREGPGFLPGRLSDLLASGRPIVASARSDSEVARLLLPSGHAACFDADGSAQAVDYFAHTLDAFERGDYNCHPLTEYARRFSSDAMAHKFAQVMDRL